MIGFKFIRSFCWFFIVLQLKDVVESKTPPNFIVVLTDDQDVVLNGMVCYCYVHSIRVISFLFRLTFFFYLNLSPQTPMQRTQKLLASKGASFINAVSSTDRYLFGSRWIHFQCRYRVLFDL